MAQLAAHGLYPTPHLLQKVGSAVRVQIAVLRQINSRAEQNPPLQNSLLVFVGRAVTAWPTLAKVMWQCRVGKQTGFVSPPPQTDPWGCLDWTNLAAYESKIHQFEPADSSHSNAYTTGYIFLEYLGVNVHPRLQGSSVCLTSQWPELLCPGQKQLFHWNESRPGLDLTTWLW